MRTKHEHARSKFRKKDIAVKPEAGIKWLFFDLNSYFASVEQQDNKSLRGKPVAVLPSMTDATCAIAASYEAKAYGVKTGTKIYKAKKMCPDLHCVPARHDLYVEYHHKILEEVVKHVPINKVCSIDELSSRLPPRLREPEAAIDAAKRLKAGLRENIGDYIRCSIGIAPNSYLAKIATDMEKPDGLVVLKPEDLPGRLLDLELMDLTGINVNMKRRLNRSGIMTVEDLWTISPKQARAAWGSVGGERFWYRLHGYEVPEIETRTTTIGHSRVLDPKLRAPDKARLVARRLTVKAAGRLRRAEFYATKFSLSIRTTNNHRWGTKQKISPTQDNFAFLKILDDLWEERPAPLQNAWLKKVSVTLHGLRQRQDITPDLFAFTQPEAREETARDKVISETVDRLNQKFGAETVRFGPSPKTEAGYVGTKIAFSRIPDRAEFNE